MVKEVITKKVDSIAFSVMPPNVIKRIGAVEVITPEIYDADGYPVKRGLMDPAMGVIDPGLRCKTCGNRLKTCPGHFGSIALSKQIVHILYVGQIYDFLRSFCKECGRILLNPHKIKKWEEPIASARKHQDLKTLRALMKEVVKTTKTIKKCPYCDAENIPIKLIKPTTFQEGDERIWPTEIHDRFEKILDEDLKILGYDPANIRPEWLILHTLSVPPITMRPSITLESGARSEDDLTHKLSDVVRVNQRLLENINAGAPEIIVEDLWDLLQYHVTTFFNNKVSQIPPARLRTQQELKTLAQRLGGKEGRFRYNLAGKRVNFCARSVISPDPYIDISEVGIPLKIAKELTIPETVTEWNIKWLKGLIKSKVHPCATYIVTLDNKRKKITDETIDQILKELCPGWIVERQLQDGDIIIINRQPSLHRLSIMGHFVKIMPGRTIRLNPAVDAPYNADFDGDEMNLHVPQTEEARAEASNLMILKNQIITPRYGLSVISAIQDCLLGVYYLTKDMLLTPESASDLLLDVGIDAQLPKPDKSGKISGKQVFSVLLPKNLNFTTDGHILKDNKSVKGEVEVKDGQLIRGIIDKKLIGTEGGVLIHRIYRDYGSDITSEFINKCCLLGLAVGKKVAHTMSFYDIDIPEEERNEIKHILDEADKETKKIMEEFSKNKIEALPGQTINETFESYMLNALTQVRGKTEKIIEKKLNEDSTIVNAIKAGAQFKLLHIALMAGFAGQQALRGQRINFGYTGRTLSHFKKGDLGPKAHGFVKQSYAHGLGPQELFFNAIVGRDSLMDTAMRTPKSGYMQRRLINALQDLKVDYDGTVRDSGRSIVQFKFGGDNIDVSKSDGGKINVK